MPTRATEEQITERIVEYADRLSNGFDRLSDILAEGDWDIISLMMGIENMDADFKSVQTGLAVLAYIQADEETDAS